MIILTILNINIHFDENNDDTSDNNANDNNN